MTRLGVLLVVAGLAMLGYVGWEMYGTTYVARRDQERTVERTLRAWTAPVAVGEPSGASGTPTGEAVALVRVPAFGAAYVVPVFEGTGDDVLARGFGHFGHSAGPGQVGNYALAAHRITHGEPLRRMPELGPGDRVVVQTRTATYTYELDTDPEALVVDFTQGWVVDPVPTNPVAGGVQPSQRPGQRLITLTTCAELFHTDERMIAFGHLVGRVSRA